MKYSLILFSRIQQWKFPNICIEAYTSSSKYNSDFLLQINITFVIRPISPGWCMVSHLDYHAREPEFEPRLMRFHMMSPYHVNVWGFIRNVEDY
jgi:hypothetical protein